MKANDPLTIAISLIIIAGVILFVNSLTSQQAVAPVLPPVQGGETAPELQGIAGYINTEPFNLSDYRGKVILVDFWTYSCINCIRTLPYLTAWDEKYRDKGLVIIGVHTPEFEFEKNYDNVQKAVMKNNIEYAVVLDNDYQTWRAYGNRFWPRKYLIDANGSIRYDHIGEGAYQETELMIQKLLAERNASVGQENLVDLPEGTDFLQERSPEIYLGYSFALPRGQDIGNGGFSPGETATYVLPDDFSRDVVYLEGDWKSNDDNIELVSDTGKVVLKYRAKYVNIVAGGNSTISANNQTYGITTNTLYTIVSNEEYKEDVLLIDVEGDFKLYTFTFG